ncbi:MAG: efflux RND transporter permease subunit [Planctomycetota bacterium]|nr:efflux RND transporter permease subunit [Planctomycetota bacterium]
MSLPRFSVRNPVPVNLLMVGVLVGGLIASVNLIREFFPNIEAEQIFVTVPYPGATPEEIERSVTRLVEREIEDVDGIDEIKSRVFEGITVVTAELEDGANRDRVLNDVRGEIDKVKPDLPDGAEDPEVREARPYIPAIAVVITGDVDEDRLHGIVEDVRDDLLDIDVVTEVIVTGFRAREFLVEILPERIEEYRLTYEEVGRAVASLNTDIPGGQLKGRTTNIRVRTMAEDRVARELEKKVILTSPAGQSVRLGDVAVVRSGFEDKTEKGRFLRVPRDEEGNLIRPEGGGPLRTKPAATINVFKAPEQDAIKIAEAVRKYVKDKPDRLGGAVQLEATTDISRFIEQRIDLMSRNAIAGLILVLIVLAIFLELRIAFWTAIGLLFSFSGTFLVMLWTGQSINLISLFGLIVVLGLIVDDAIVVGENIFAKQRAGMSPERAAVAGTREVTIPVVAAVLTTCAAFAPLAFIEGRIGDFLGVLPAIVICALGVSLVEAFAILPGHLGHSRMTRRTKKEGQKPTFIERFRAGRHKLFEDILPGSLEWSLRRLIPFRYAAVAAGLALVMVAFGLVAGGIVPFVLLQDTDAETVTVKLEMAAGTPEETTIARLGDIEALAAEQPEVRSIFSVLGASFSDRGRETASDPAVVGQITLELLPSEDRQAAGMRTSIGLMTDMRVATRDLPGVRRLSYVSQGGGPQGVDVELRVRADELETLKQGVAHVRKLVDSYVGVTESYDDLELGKPEARMRLRKAARLAGLTSRDVAVQIRHALFGFEAQDLQIGNEEVTVRVVLPETAREDLNDLGALYIRTPSGGRMPLVEAVDFEMERGYASLARVDTRRAATIKAEIDETKANVAKVNAGLKKQLETISEEIPGVSVTFEGARRETQESVGSLQYLFPIAMLLIFAIIAILFRSYVQPVIVMASIPFAMIGAIGGHFLLGYPYTILSMIGTVALAGIVVNDGLILVDLANRKRREGEPLIEAVVGAARGRMRAILLTSITTCVGLAPLMLEKSFQAQFLIPMAVAIVFGLAFATVIILVLVPLMYLIIEDLRACMRWLSGGKFSRHLAYDPALHMDDPSS